MRTLGKVFRFLLFVALVVGLARSSCFDIRDFGAKAGNADDGLGQYWDKNTVAIQQAIDAAGDVASSGLKQCVLVAGGDYISSDIYLRSNLVFIIESDSRLITAANKTSVGLLLVNNVSNVEITGRGTIYGNAEHYIKYYDPVDDRFEPTAADGSRPRLLYLESSNNVYIHDISIQNASDWHVHAVACRNLTIDRVTVYGDWRYPNNDGIDIDSCIDVVITNSDINVADDGVCLKSTDGHGPLLNLRAENLTLRSKSHAIKFGSVCDTDISNISFNRIKIWDSNSGMAIQQRSTGNISNVSFSNIVSETRYVAPAWWGNGEWFAITAEQRNKGDSIGIISNISVVNVTASSENGGLVSGRYAGVYNVRFQNIKVTMSISITSQVFHTILKIQINIVQWSNYSTGQGPLCQSHNIFGNASLPCMGTQDHRPSFIEVTVLVLFMANYL